MRHVFSILGTLLLATTAGRAADRVVLKNGDMLTGEVVRQTATQLFFKSPALGSVVLERGLVAEVRVAEADRAAPADPPRSKEKPAMAPIKTARAKKEPATKPRPHWSGEAGVSVAMRESNTLRRSGDSITEKQESYESYKVFGHLDWKDESQRHNLRWDWTYRYSRSDLRKNDDYLNLTQNYKHTFEDDSLFASAKTLYQQDYRRKIENEFLQTAEMGVKWFDAPTFKLSTSAGAGYHAYDRLVYNSGTASSEDFFVAQPKFIFDESLRWQLVSTLALIQKYTHLGDLTDYHFTFSTGLENKLVRDLFLRVEYRLDRDTEMSYDDKGYYDKALLTSIRYKF